MPFRASALGLGLTWCRARARRFHLRHELAQLLVGVVPLAHAEVGEEVVGAGAAQLAGRQVLRLIVVPPPELQEGDEVALQPTLAFASIH